jgi:hypothetical protein
VLYFKTKRTYEDNEVRETRTEKVQRDKMIINQEMSHIDFHYKAGDRRSVLAQVIFFLEITLFEMNSGTVGNSVSTVSHVCQFL